MTKPVCATNLDTVHRIACVKRDIQGDDSDLARYTKSVLFDSACDAARKAARAQELDGWWGVDTVTLFDDGTVEFIVCTHRTGEKDITKTRCVHVAFTVCDPSEVPDLLQHDKALLNYWFLPE